MIGSNKSAKIILFVSFFMFLSCLGTVSAKDFTQTDTSKNVQDFIDDTSSTDSVINLNPGTYSLKELNITRELTIQSKSDTSVVNIKGDGKSTLFNVKHNNVVIKGLNIVDFGVAISSTEDKLTVKNNKITHTDTRYNTTGVIIRTHDNDESYNNDNVIEGNVINTTKESIVLDVRSTSSKDTFIENNIIRNNTIFSWLNNAIYSNTQATIRNIAITNNYIESRGTTGILLYCKNLLKFNFNGNTVRSESESKPMMDIKYNKSVEDFQIIDNDISSNFPVAGIIVNNIDSSIASNIKDIVVKDNTIKTSKGSLSLSATGKIENFELSNNELYLVNINGAYVSNFNVQKNNFVGESINISPSGGIDNFTVENNKFNGGKGIDIGATADQTGYVNNVLVNKNTGTINDVRGLLYINNSAYVNNVTVSNNNIDANLVNFNLTGGNLTGLYIENNTGKNIELYVHIPAYDVHVRNNNITGHIEYIMDEYVDNIDLYNNVVSGTVNVDLGNIPEKFILTEKCEYSRLILNINSPDHDTEMYISNAVVNSLTISIADTGKKTNITIINSTISSLSIANSNKESQINVIDNNISDLQLRFSNSQANAIITGNLFDRSGAIIEFAGAFDCDNFIFKNNNFTGNKGIEIYNYGSTTVSNLKISDNNIDVIGNGILIDSGSNRQSGAIGSNYGNFDNLIISNNVINSDTNGIYFNSFKYNSVQAANALLSNILIKDNIINALTNGIYYSGSFTLAGISISNNSIENNIIYGGQSGVVANVNNVNGFNLISNEIMGKTNDGIRITVPMTMGTLYVFTISDVIINYNSIVSPKYRLWLYQAPTGTNNIDYNWWGANDISTSDNTKFVIYTLVMNNYYNVRLHENGASFGGNKVLHDVVLSDGSKNGIEKLPNFYVSVNNNGIIENVSAKDGELEVLAPGYYLIRYNNGESTQTIVLNDGDTQSTYIETKEFKTYLNETIDITATLKDVHGVGIKDKTLYFNINGEEYSAVTNSNGIATISYHAATEGYFDIIITFKADDGDTKYFGTFTNTAINVTIKPIIEPPIKDVLQELIDNTATGGVLNLNGQYFENVHVIIDKSITIIGGTIVNSITDTVFTITGSDVTLNGIDITAPSVGIDIKDNASNVNILNSNIKNAHTGIILDNVTKVNILNNNITGSYDGLVLTADLNDITIIGNYMEGTKIFKGIPGSGTDGNGITLNSNIPNLRVSQNIVTNFAKGIFIGAGFGAGDIDIYEKIIYNSFAGNGFSLEIDNPIRSVPDTFRTGPNYYGGETTDLCYRFLFSATPILANLTNIDNQGNVLVSFHYTDLNGQTVIATELPDLPAEFSLNNIGRDPVTAINGEATMDYTSRVFNNAGIGATIWAYVGDQTFSIFLTPDEIRGAIAEDIELGLRNPDGSFVTTTDNDGGSSSNGGQGSNIGFGTGTGSSFGTGSGIGLGGTGLAGFGSGSGFGTGTGSGSGFGTGTGSGTGSGDGTGSGMGTGSGEGNINNADNGQGSQGSQVANAGSQRVSAASDSAGGETGGATGGDSGADSSNDGKANKITPVNKPASTSNDTTVNTAIGLLVIVLVLAAGMFIRRQRNA